MIKVKMELQKRTDSQVIDLLELVATKIEGNATFPAPPVAPDTLTDDADAIEALIDQRDALLLQAQQVTLQIRAARDKGEADLNATANYVEGIINKIVPPATSVDPVVAAAQALSAGLDVADGSSPVGPMPKVTGLTATQGDEDGEVDLQWASIRRGLQNYEGSQTEDPTGQTGWEHSFIASKSKTSVPGLVSGKRYWFRVRAIGAEGPGPWSDPASKVAP